MLAEVSLVSELRYPAFFAFPVVANVSQLGSSVLFVPLPVHSVTFLA